MLPNCNKLQSRSTGCNHVIRFLREAKVIEILYERLLSTRILLIHFILSYLITLCLFCLIQLHQQITWELGIILVTASSSALFGWIIVLWLLSQYCIGAKGFTLSWKTAEWPCNGHDRKLMKKFYRSCKPIEFCSNPRILRFRPVTIIKYIHFINWILTKSLIITNK